MFKMENGFYWVDWKLHFTPTQGLASPRLNWDGRGHGVPVPGVDELDGYNGSLSPQR